MMPESTRALVIGLFVVTGRAELSGPELIQLARPCGVTATNLKCHLSRMVQDGSLVRRGSPRTFRYAPSTKKGALIDAIQARLEGTDETWNGEWILLAVRLPRERDARASARRHLRFDGFRMVSPGAYARPAWPRPWAAERAARHLALAEGVHVMGRLEPPEEQRLLGLYDRAALDARAKHVLDKVQRVLARPPVPQRAFALRIEIGERMARLFADDPRLPPELWGPYVHMRELARAHARLEHALGRTSQPFLRSVLHPSARAQAVGA